MRILVACVGNIFFGDDGFGVEVARELSRRVSPQGVSVVDFGIRGLDLTYALTDGDPVVILVDAVPRGGESGTLYLMEPAVDGTDIAGSGPLMDAHGMDTARVLRLASSMGGKVGRMLIVGFEPAVTGDMESFIDGLSEPVRAAVGREADLVMSLVGWIQNGEEIGGTGNDFKLR